MPLTPFRIQKFLGGLRYPARKDQVLGALHTLPDRAYESPISVSRQIGQPPAS